MSLATRCTHCGTIFKVVQDQLKVSEGWVRCGRCNEVFNALPALFDLDTEPPPPRQAPTPPPAPPASPAPSTAAAPTRPAAPAPASPSTPPPAAPTPAAAQARPTAPASPPTPGLTAPSSPPAPKAIPTTPSATTARPVPPTRPATPPAAAPAAPATPTRADVLGDAPLNLGQPRKPLSDFNLDTSVPLRDVPAAVPPGGAVVDDFDTGTDSVPMTYEADALESRYLLPSTSRSRKPAARRSTGPEFADAEFPTDAWLDAEDNWSLDLPPLPSTAPPSLARQPGAAAPVDSTAASAPGVPPTPDSAAPNSTELAAQALAALSALPAADSEPHGLSAPSPTLRASTANVVQDNPVEDVLDIATVPSRFAGDEDNSVPPTTVAIERGVGSGPTLTEAELLASRQKRPGRKGRAAQAPTPEFIRQAERQALWRNPGIRGVLTGLSLALGLTLAAQVAHHQRDWLAAHQPALKPWLSQWCSLVGCELKLLRQLDQLQVDHAAFVRAESEGPDRYRLSLVVRNLAKTELAWPAVDLVLNDANGQVMARRTLKVGDADWLAEAPVRASTGVRPPEAINAAATGTLSWSLQLEDLTPAGYTAELFYLPDQP